MLFICGHQCASAFPCPQIKYLLELTLIDNLIDTNCLLKSPSTSTPSIVNAWMCWFLRLFFRNVSKVKVTKRKQLTCCKTTYCVFVSKICFITCFSVIYFAFYVVTLQRKVWLLTVLHTFLWKLYIPTKRLCNNLHAG